MTNVLWIPVFDEGTQNATWLDPVSHDVVSTQRHTLVCTLNLLTPYLYNRTFDEIIISNDGSTDDTMEGLNELRKENRLGNKLTVITGNKRMGKMERFFEVCDSLRKKSIGILGMTDADMLTNGGTTFSRLFEMKGFQNGTQMLASHQGEFDSKLNGPRHYTISDATSSGTRSIYLPDMPIKLKNALQNTSPDYGTGYGLEIFLNKMIGVKNISHVQARSDMSHIPLFLEAYRKGKDKQREDITKTNDILGGIKNEPVTINTGQYQFQIRCVKKNGDLFSYELLLKNKWIKIHEFHFYVSYADLRIVAEVVIRKCSYLLGKQKDTWSYDRGLQSIISHYTSSYVTATL